ncbi:hypothetical protein Ancab_030608 [Ancistrocladus abbreviatus]
MNNDSQGPQSGGGGYCSTSRIRTVQPLRDLESNGAVDLAKSLEYYLLKICCGEITGGDDDHISINFAECLGYRAALLLRGSIQVYCRKVEYLYTLVLHALEFISQKRPQYQAEGAEVQPEAISSHAVHHDDGDQFRCLDDIPVDAKNSLDDLTSKDAPRNRFVKHPANMVVLEGDCLNSTHDDGELEFYLLVSNDPCCNFILLDPCDAVVDDFWKGDRVGDGQHGGQRGNSLHSKAHKSFLSPPRSGGTARKSSQRKVQGNTGQTSPDLDDIDGDDDDPWKPLNPHEPGNLEVKPFRKVKTLRRPGAVKQISLAAEFPLAKLHGTISPELAGYWEKQHLRQSLIHGGHGSNVNFCHPEDDSGDDGFDDGINDFEQPDFDMPASNYMDKQGAFHSEKHDDFPNHFCLSEPNENEDPNSQASLEDLCPAHLDSLLASIAESEKQTELAARLSTWKQRIEHNLEEEDSRPLFDIHEYSKRVLDKLSAGGNAMFFADVVMGEGKHDVARMFSALLQLVNDVRLILTEVGRVVNLCHTAVNPFHIQLVSQDSGRDKMQFSAL